MKLSSVPNAIHPLNSQPNIEYDKMQDEDDLRGLAKVMAFMRAVSILLVLMHLYWSCYGFFIERKGLYLQYRFLIEKHLHNHWLPTKNVAQ